MRYSLQAKTHN